MVSTRGFDPLSLGSNPSRVTDIVSAVCWCTRGSLKPFPSGHFGSNPTEITNIVL